MCLQRVANAADHRVLFKLLHSLHVCSMPHSPPKCLTQHALHVYPQAASAAREQTKQAAFVSAVWSLAYLAGPAYFAPEMESLLKIARLGSWTFEAADLADVVWALAHSRHGTSRLPDVERAVVRAGSLARCKPSEVAAILVGLATLGYKPRELLAGISPGWCIESKAK